MEYTAITTSLIILTEMEISLIEINIKYLITNISKYLL
jgi:hypothetical protein